MISSLDEQYSFVAPRPGFPDLQRMPGGEVERQLHVVVGGREITDVQRDRTRRKDQAVQKRERVILQSGVIHEALREPRCLIAQSLHPQNARVRAIDDHSRVELIEVDVRRPSRRQAQADQRLEVSSRTGLVSQYVQRKTDEPAGGRRIETIGGFGCNGAELLAETQGTAIVACGEAMDIESVYRPQPAPRVVRDLGKLESVREGGAHFLAPAQGVQVSVAKREIQLDVASWIVGHLTSEARNRLLGSTATFGHERQVRPQRHGGRSERDADAGITAWRKGPVESEARIIDVRPVGSEPVSDGPRLELSARMLKEVSIVLGVASRDLGELGAVDELLARVGAGRLEEAIRHHRAADIGRQQ